ncbi:MAG: site-specific integrase [Thermodesulfovibrionales bacterium]|nr:site-specific integrase [Thermodesulfovibrionales bacterium]
MDLIPVSKLTKLTKLTSASPKKISMAFHRPVPKYFSNEEIQRILSEELRGHHYKQFFFCLFLWNTGVRVSEALSVRLEDIDLMGKVLRVSTLKREGHTRAIPLQNGFLGELALWINQKQLKRGDRLFLFNRKTAYNHVHQACTVAGIQDERCHPHTFRHSFAVNCILHGVPVTVLREWLGHRDITKTLIYTQILAHDSRVFMEQVRF